MYFGPLMVHVVQLVLIKTEVECKQNENDVLVLDQILEAASIQQGSLQTNVQEVAQSTKIHYGQMWDYSTRCYAENCRSFLQNVASKEL